MDKMSFQNPFANIHKVGNYDDSAQCPYCHDSGWLITDKGAVPCTCKKNSEIARRKILSGITPALEMHTFSNFDLRYYADFLQIEQGASYRVLAQRSLDAAKRFSREIQKGKKPRCLLFEGDVGRGKTHLAAAIANDLIEHGKSAKFVIVPEFLDALRFSYQNNEMNTESYIVRNIQDAPVLILDDLGAHNYSEWTKGKLFTLINHRLNYLLPTVFTTNLKVTELDEVLGSRIVSRILEMSDTYGLFSEEDLRIKLRKIKHFNGGKQ